MTGGTVTLEVKPPYDWKKSAWKAIRRPLSAFGAACFAALLMPETRAQILAVVPAKYAGLVGIIYGAFVASGDWYVHRDGRHTEAPLDYED